MPFKEVKVGFSGLLSRKSESKASAMSWSETTIPAPPPRSLLISPTSVVVAVPSYTLTR